ncbi:zinc knuckle CX2CX4HX4C containing protein [Tanacetum coccineum]|uniref:Zinc knuckle CX2CX4HX4C containing protein n=1 Tax=Tanacetum coccineum TaxID=301880 RepID=A0ABQ5BNE0_9ASTR
MDASDTNSLTNATKQAAGPKVNTSFASVIKSNQNKVVQITELRNEEHVEGAAVTIPLSAIKRIKRIQLHGDFFLFQFETKEGMDRVLENGPWLIQMVPLILNVWSPDSDLHKAKIKKFQCGHGPMRHSLAIIRIEYEWTPPSKSYLEEWPDDDFEVVKKIDKKKKHQKQVDGVVLNKPSLTLHYRRVDRGNSTKQSGSYVASTSKEGGKSAATSTQSKNVRLENSFSALNDDEIIMKRINTTWHLSQHLEC